MEFLVSNSFHKEQVFYLFGIAFKNVVPKLKALVPEASPIVFERKAFIGFGEIGVFLNEAVAKEGKPPHINKKIATELFSGEKKEAFKLAQEQEKREGTPVYVGELKSGKFLLLKM